MKLRDKIGDKFFREGQKLKTKGKVNISDGTIVIVAENDDLPWVKEAEKTPVVTCVSSFTVEPYLILPTLEEVQKMNIEALSEEQLNEISQAIAEALGEPAQSDKVDDLDLQLAIWDCMEQYDIPRDQIGALITLHGERLIGEVLAKQLIGLV